MKKNEIKIGGHYTAKVSGNLVTVRVDAIRQDGSRSHTNRRGNFSPPSTLYDVTNLATGRKTVFRSAAKFRSPVASNDAMFPTPKGASRDPKPQTVHPITTGDLSKAGPQPNQLRGQPPAAIAAEEGGPAELALAKSETGETLGDFLADPTNGASVPTAGAPSMTTDGVPSAKSPATNGTYGDKQQKLADQLRKAKDPCVDDAPHLIVEARAGTGKTTTLVEGLKRVKGLPTSLVPSPQQAAVWEAMELSKGKVQTICFVAFNKSIATELQTRVPAGCNAMTMHSMGYSAVKRAFPNLKNPNSYRVQDIISELMERDIRELRKYKPEVLRATESIVGLCKMNLSHRDECGNELLLGDPDWTEVLSKLAAHYDVDLNGSQAEVFELVPRVLERCKDVGRDNCIDFDDMIWLPVALGLSVYKYDLLLWDESQDGNKCQQALAMKAGRRLILCGDRHQAIYGFAGADSNALTNMEKMLGESERGVTLLPLTVTRRCGKAIVAEAQKIVPDFDAFETNPAGEITRMSLEEVPCSRCGGSGDEPKTPSGADPCQTCDVCFGNGHTGYAARCYEGDMVLCRCNAPLVSECFKFLKAGRRANIQGRDVGQGLISTIKKLKPTDVVDLVGKISDWLHAETAKENAKRNPSEQRLIALQDRADCLTTFTEGAATVEAVLVKIETIFTDSKTSPGIKLSSVHKAKGLEARRVFILQPAGATMPHPMAKSAWQREQEMNLLYVAITRAIEELVYVS